MKDKEARADIAGLKVKTDYINRKLDRVDTKVFINPTTIGIHKITNELNKKIIELEEELAAVRKLAAKEPAMYTTDMPNTWIFVPTPTRVPLARAIRLILKHLNIEIHGIAKGYELKEIVDDDKAKD